MIGKKKCHRCLPSIIVRVVVSVVVVVVELVLMPYYIINRIYEAFVSI